MLSSAETYFKQAHEFFMQKRYKESVTAYEQAFHLASMLIQEVEEKSQTTIETARYGERRVDLRPLPVQSKEF